MRKPTIFISIPGSQRFRTFYYKCLKKIEEKNRLEVICFFDEPPVQIFERTISTHIAYCNLTIGILDSRNQNISYELGLSIGYGKPIILLADRKTKIQSMLRHYDIIFYDKTKMDYDKILKKIHESIDRNFYSKYLTLRAKTHSQLLIKIEESNIKRKSIDEQDDILQMAIREYKESDYQAAINILSSRPLSEVADSDDFYFFLCDSYFLESERMEEGGKKNLYIQKMLEVATSGLKLYPNNQVLLKSRGLALLKMKQLSAAKNVFEKLLKEYPNYDVARYNLACVYAQLGDLFSTLQNLNIIIENEESWRSLARLDPDFDPLWHKDLFQRLLFPIQKKM